MDKIKEYIENLDTKNLIYLYLSIVLIGIMVYYHVNYSIFQKEIDKNNEKIEKYRKNLAVSKSLEVKIVKIKKRYKTLQKNILSLKEDLKYLNLLIKTSNILNLKDKRFLNILQNILDYGVKNNINASYLIDKKFIKDFIVYTLEIKGEILADNYKNFFNYIKDLEKLNVIKDFIVVSFKEKDLIIDYYLKIKMRGIK